MLLETLVCSPVKHLTLLVAREYFTESSRRESCKLKIEPISVLI